jgi:hypothetical protein
MTRNEAVKWILTQWMEVKERISEEVGMIEKRGVPRRRLH